MKKQKVVDIIFWTLAVVWCVVIFLFSAENGEQSSGTSGRVCRAVAQMVIGDFEEMSDTAQLEIIESMQFYVRKTAHFCAYALLSFFIAMALRRKKPLARGVLSVGLSAAYAISDELHQAVVSDRNGSFKDVVLDTSGTVAGFFAAWAVLVLILAFQKKSRKNNG